MHGVTSSANLAGSSFQRAGTFFDNNRKPLCRLHFNRSKKYVGLFDDSKGETRHLVDGPEGLYQFADQLREAARRYIAAPPSTEGTEQPTTG